MYNFRVKFINKSATVAMLYYNSSTNHNHFFKKVVVGKSYYVTVPGDCRYISVQYFSGSLSWHGTSNRFIPAHNLSDDLQPNLSDDLQPNLSDDLQSNVSDNSQPNLSDSKSALSNNYINLYTYNVNVITARGTSSSVKADLTKGDSYDPNPHIPATDILPPERVPETDLLPAERVAEIDLLPAERVAEIDLLVPEIDLLVPETDLVSNHVIKFQNFSSMCALFGYEQNCQDHDSKAIPIGYYTINVPAGAENVYIKALLPNPDHKTQSYQKIPPNPISISSLSGNDIITVTGDIFSHYIKIIPASEGGCNPVTGICQ